MGRKVKPQAGLVKVEGLGGRVLSLCWLCLMSLFSTGCSGRLLRQLMGTNLGQYSRKLKRLIFLFKLISSADFYN